MTNDADNRILYGKLKTTTGLAIDETVSLNFKDLRKLIKVFECIPEDTFELKIDDSASVISYKSPALSFKLHLVLDSVIKKNIVSLDKISKLTFDSDFELTSEKITEILRGSIVASIPGKEDKIYFYTKDKSVYAELTDKSIQDVDSITFSIAEKYNGIDITSPLPFNMEILRLMTGNKFDKLNVKVNNTHKILLFEICNPQVMFKYIISGYTK